MLDFERRELSNENVRVVVGEFSSKALSVADFIDRQGIITVGVAGLRRL